MRHNISGLRDLYLKHVSKSGFRGPYKAYTRPQRSLPETCAENVAQIEIDVSRN